MALTIANQPQNDTVPSLIVVLSSAESRVRFCGKIITSNSVHDSILLPCVSLIPDWLKKFQNGQNKSSPPKPLETCHLSQKLMDTVPVTILQFEKGNIWSINQVVKLVTIYVCIL